MNTKTNQNNLAAASTTQLNILTLQQMVAASTHFFAALPASWHYGVSLLFTLFAIKSTIIFPLRVRVRVFTAIFGLEEIHNDRSRLWASVCQRVIL